MEDKLSMILGTIGSILLTAFLAFIFNRLGKVLDNQIVQGSAIDVIKMQVSGLTSKVESLNQWRNLKQEEEISDLKEIISEFNKERNRRQGDIK